MGYFLYIIPAKLTVHHSKFSDLGEYWNEQCNDEGKCQLGQVDIPLVWQGELHSLVLR